MAEASSYSWGSWTISYAPDPQNPSKYKEISRAVVPPKLYKCEWCGSGYDFEKYNCPNCGGPRID